MICVILSTCPCEMQAIMANQLPRWSKNTTCTIGVHHHTHGIDKFVPEYTKFLLVKSDYFLRNPHHLLIIALTSVIINHTCRGKKTSCRLPYKTSSSSSWANNP